MEKAILKTLIYANIFDYPLNIFEIHKWLIDKKSNLRQVESVLGRLLKSGKCKMQNGYYFLPKKDGLINKRKRREKQSDSYLRKARLLGYFLKLVPWIKVVGVSGGLAMENADKRDDIDLFIITSKNRLWVSRILTLGFLSLTGQRRKPGDTGRAISGKLCLNTLLEEEKLEQKSKDIFIAHEVLQMKVLWQRDGMYSKYLSDNDWAFNFLPNWVDSNPSLRGAKRRSNSFGLAMTLERLAKWFQLKIMGKPQGMERIEDGALYFHPKDYRFTVLAQYRQKIKNLSTP